MAPHQLRISSARARFVEPEKFLIFIERDFVFALQIMFFRNLHLVALHLAHSFEGLDRNLFRPRQLLGQPRSGKTDYSEEDGAESLFC